MVAYDDDGYILMRSVVSIGDTLEFRELIPLYGRSLAGRLMPRPTQARLPIVRGDRLILFLNTRNRWEYSMVNPVQAVYYYVPRNEEGHENRVFTSVNRHNHLVLTEQDLLWIKEENL